MSTKLSNEKYNFEMQRLDVKVCRLFYQDHLTKTEIEKKLHISRFKVADIIRKAHQSGLVEIKIAEPYSNLSELERKLEFVTGLKSVILVSDTGESPEHLKEKVGQIASNYLLKIINKGDVLGIGWGTTTAALVNALPHRINKKVFVVQVSGGTARLPKGIDSQALTIRLAEKFDVSPFLLHAPAIVDRKETRDVLTKESAFLSIFNLYKKIDIVIAGIGAFLPDKFLGTRLIDPLENEALRYKDAVGEFLYYCFDSKGNICQTETLDRIIAIPITDIKKASCSIAITVGVEKVKAILGAIRTGLINALITDATTAKAILENLNHHHRKEKKGDEN
jgi:DNA-binding transcriptional regulator LsrR (DeoR family)